MNKEMPAEQLKEHILDFLKEHKQASLATCGDGLPRCSPVQYFLGRGMDIYILSAGGDKFMNIRQNPRVCLLASTEYINYRQIKGVQVFGTASTSEENASLFDEAIRYTPDKHMMEHERDSIKVIKVVPDEIVYLDSLVMGDRTKQVLKGDRVEIREERVLAGHR